MKKMANALIADAKAGVEAYIVPLATGGISGAVALGCVMAAAKALMGGLWVGGEVELNDSAIEFRPNAINRFLHQGDYRVSIPLTEITDVKNEFGLVTGIVRLESKYATLKIRVYGAKPFAEEIRDQIAKVSSRQPSQGLRGAQ